MGFLTIIFKNACFPGPPWYFLARTALDPYSQQYIFPSIMEVRKFVQHVKKVACGHFDNQMTALRLMLSPLHCNLDAFAIPHNFQQDVSCYFSRRAEPQFLRVFSLDVSFFIKTSQFCSCDLHNAVWTKKSYVYDMQSWTKDTFHDRYQITLLY
jgi:hypothetical protein